MIATRSGNSLAGITFVTALHLLLFYFLLRGQPRMDPPSVPHYSQLLLILAPRKPVPIETPRLPPRIAPSKPVLPRKQQTESTALAIESAADQATTPESIAKPAAADHADPFHESVRPNGDTLHIDSLIKQAGKADRETRPVNEIHAYGPTRDSMEAVMTRAFTEAKLAVPLKWYEAARIELFSAPNDPRKIYQVKTAFGTYCLFYPSIYEDSGGGAAARQPKMSSCPKRFGAGAR